MLAKIKIPRDLLLILIIASVLRLWGIKFGLPDSHIIDEDGQIYGALYAGYNALKPVRYMYAPLQPYLLFFEYGIYFIVGFLTSHFTSAFEFLVAFLKNPTPLFLIGRITMALFGVGSVWLTYAIGRKFLNPLIGRLSALFLAVTFLHVKESHYIKQDVLSTFFLLLCFFWAGMILVRAKMRDYLLAGISFALALGTKYQTGLILPIIFLAHFIKGRQVAFKHLSLFLVSSLATFILINPYTVINFQRFTAGTLSDFGHANIKYEELLQGKPLWYIFLTEHIPQGMGMLMFFAALGGFVVAFQKARKATVYGLIPLIPLIFLITVDRWTQYPSARYAVIILPFFALGAAVFLEQVTKYLRPHKVRLIALIFGSFLLSSQSLARDVKFDWLLTQKDTRALSKEWIERSIPAESLVLVESTVKPEYPSNLNTPLVLSRAGIRRRLGDASSRHQDATYLRALEKANQDKIGYDIRATPRVDRATDIFTSSQRVLVDASSLASENVTYLVLSSWAIRPDVTPEFLTSLTTFYELIQKFTPAPEFADDPHLIRMDFQVLDNLPISSDHVVFGPTISVYRLRHR